MSEIPDSAESDAWASGADGSPEAMGAVQNALPVQLIATPRRDFKTCRPEDDLECELPKLNKQKPLALENNERS